MNMSLSDWYGKREILLVGVTSELGRILLEKLLRSLPDVRVYTIVRSRASLTKDDRIKSIFASPGYQRLRQQDPNAMTRVMALEGNLLYERLGLSDEDSERLKNVEIAFHAAGPHDEVFQLCRQLPHLRTIAVVSSLFKHKGEQITEALQNENIPDIPLAILRMPLLGPAHKEPMPGYVDIMKGPTALMVGAGYALGKSKFSAELLPIDLAANALIVTAWERGVRSRTDEPMVYNVPILGCTWGDLIEKGYLANKKFSYPTFGVRGMTSIGWFHWIVVLLLEWMPSALCDTILSAFGAKPRCVQEHDKVRNALRSLEPIASRSWPVERNRIYQLQKRLTLEDKDVYPICADIDIESYVLCAAASAKKYCVNETNVKIVKNFRRLLFALVVILTFYHFCK